jgi:sec-independent protein translocase protein TatC
MSSISMDLRKFTPEISRKDRSRKLRTVILEGLAVGAAMATEMSFLEHLEELRSRILKSLVALAAGMALCWAFVEPLIRFLGVPARLVGIHLVAIESTDIFSLYFTVALAGAACLAAPFILWQVWLFVSPGLHPHERRYAGPFIISTSLCFIGGAIFGYRVMMPLTLKLIAAMARAVHIDVTMSVTGYFNLLVVLIVSMGIVFEISPVIFILSRIGLVSGRFLARNFKYAILISCIAAAVLTPSQDASTMILVSIPIILSYGLGIIVAAIFGKKRQAEAA